MECERATTLLPWLFNGSLEADERLQVESHLTSCAACRRELRDTAIAWAATGAHPPAEVITDYGLGMELKGFPREALEAHLADCSFCEGEVAIILADGGEESPQETPFGSQTSSSTTRPTSPRIWHGWPAVALAASLTAAVLGTALIWQSAKPAAPQGNLTIVELFPRGPQTRDVQIPEPDAEVVTLSASGPAALVLVPGEHRVGESYRVTLHSYNGQDLWSLDGLVLFETGDVALLVPTKALPQERLRLELQVHFDGGWKKVADYPLALER